MARPDQHYKSANLITSTVGLVFTNARLYLPGPWRRSPHKPPEAIKFVDAMSYSLVV